MINKSMLHQRAPPIRTGRAKLVSEEELPMTMALHKKRIGEVAFFPNGFALVFFTNEGATRNEI